jgi:phosphoribosyl-AMP cyclohydrolase
MNDKLSPEILALLKDPNTLIPAVVQDKDSNEVLMLSIATGKATYWSRSRNELWEKGLTSGNSQIIHSISIDCDGDSILLKVEQQGAACHTGNKSCFYRTIS